MVASKKERMHPSFASPLNNNSLEIIYRQSTFVRDPNQRGRTRLSLFANDLILYIEDPKYSTKKNVRTNQQIR